MIKISWRNILRKLDPYLRALIALFYLLVVVLAASAPLLQETRGYPAGESIYGVFVPICHQYPTRSFWWFNRPWALCARCSSAYLAVALSASFLFIRKPYWKRIILGFSLIALAAIDPLLQLQGLHESTNFLRFLTGILGGAGAFLTLYPIPITTGENHE